MGLLLVQNSKKASEKCVFKPDAGNATITYNPNEIAGYRYINGKYYISKEIKIDSTTKKVVFLEFLIKGMANIYYYVDNDGEHYYIEKIPQGFIELTEKMETYKGDNGSYIKPSKTKGKLMWMMDDCPGINNEIQNTRLTHKSLIKLTKDYTEKVCGLGSCVIYERGNTSAKVKFGVILGYSKNQYNFGNQLISNYGDNYQIGAALKLSNFLMFNRHFNLKFNFLIEKDSKSYTLSLLNGVHMYPVTYGSDSYILNDIDFKGGDSILYPYLPSIKADLDVIVLKIPIILNYDFNLSKNTIFTCGIGISNKIILSQNMDVKIDEFYSRYGKNINTLISGVIATTGIEGNWLGKHSVFVNIAYEHFLDLRSRADQSLRLTNKQFSLQAGIYF